MNRIIVLLIIANLAMISAVFQPDNPTAIPVKQNEEALDTFTGRLMDQCRARVSAARRKLLAQQIARIAQDHFHTREHREAFALLVCIESAFQSSAHSKAGAVGLTQVMSKYARKFATDCGLGELGDGDLLDSEVNLTLGACLFQRLLVRFDGNIGLALAGYNSGPDSPTTKQAALLQNINSETSNYLAKFLVLQEATK